jgi:hypothetical protein
MKMEKWWQILSFRPNPSLVIIRKTIKNVLSVVEWMQSNVT